MALICHVGFGSYRTITAIFGLAGKLANQVARDPPPEYPMTITRSSLGNKAISYFFIEPPVVGGDLHVLERR